ncbi:MAG TPA: hypothetical protein VJU59_16960 [Paraburkholderia sp.]|jgi:unspecific monooxygenase|uniref:hypothetical protein n=1 Tax=Paraburkholderia sp. TaxID=1926495 RepID=UPI002B47041A|nr:hypothetical protein [Paraburkholderia sp.]HKR41341.1 hypothetical protein [Paraburkholderia sp.]
MVHGVEPFGAGCRVLQRYTLSAPDGMAAPRPMLNVTLRPQTPLHLALAPA